MDHHIDQQLEGLIQLVDALSPERDPKAGLAVRPGYPMYRPNAEFLGQSRPGDRILHVQSVAPGPVRLPMPIGHPQEWVQGQINDAAGPAFTLVMIPAAAINPHE